MKDINDIEVITLPNNTNGSSIVKFVTLIYSVLPLTVKLPVIDTFPWARIFLVDKLLLVKLPIILV